MLKAIMAHDKNFGIGLNNALPWKFPGDLAYFKQVTTGHVIVMGNNTWKSLGCKPLPNRVNVVIATEYDPLVHRDADIVFNANGGISYNPDCTVVFLNSGHIIDTITRSVEAIFDEHHKDVWIIGGAEIYKQFLPHTEELHLSAVVGDYQCDTFLNPFTVNKTLDLAAMRHEDGFCVSIYR